MLQAVRSSIGRKVLVALTGLALSGFLALHLAGNLLIYSGPETFNGYAEKLEESGLLLPAEVLLFLTFASHITFAIWVTVENWKARRVRYALKRWEGGKTFASSTMWISGPLTLVFLVVHLSNFRFAETGNLHALVVSTLQSWPYAAWYIFSMAVVATHVSHGFQSAFRTLGLTHPTYAALVVWLGRMFALAVVIGYSSIPVWISLFRAES